MEVRGRDNEASRATSDAKRRDSAASRSRRNTQSKSAQAILPDRSPSLNHGLASLPPINTSPSIRHSSSQRVPSRPSKRLSTISITSQRSRPQSTVFPVFHSSLNYSLVRDFAYAVTHPWHYGPPPESTSGVSTPASEYQRRLSDPPPATSWTASRITWAHEPSSADAALGVGPQLPATSYRDGPPYSEDDDLHSPIVTSSRHKKTKSTYADYDYARSGGESGTSQGSRTSYAGMESDGSQLFYVDHIGEGMADGPGGEYITYPPDQYAWQRGQSHAYIASDENDDTSSPEEPDEGEEDSRYSRDYSFTIASPDEEMHGKAVALFDFARENENELPLIEGQVLWVSYRHGQGWLVAQDPRSGESGLVPEEYVRLVRDIEGGLNGLNGQLADSDADSPEAETPTSTARPGMHDRTTSGNSDKYPPVVSHFSTSSRDLQPYPPHLLESQTSTPTSQPESPFRRTSDDKVKQVVAKDRDRDREKEKEAPRTAAPQQRSGSTRKAAR